MSDVLSQSEIDNLLAALSSGEVDAEEMKKEGEKQLYEADTVIYALGQVPNTGLLEKMQGCAPMVLSIGDCVAPKNMLAANTVAYSVARDIGRY